MAQITYHYTVNEILIENCKEKIISSRKFSADSKPLINSKNEANRYFAERRKLVEYWIALGIYKIDDNQIFELNIKLIEVTNGIEKEYLTRSITKAIPQSNIDFEANIFFEINKILRAIYLPSDNNYKANEPLKEQAESMVGSPKEQLDYYLILGLDTDSTVDEIISAYKKHQNLNGATMWNPDWHPEKDTYKRMRLIHEAYRILSNEELRAKYDLEYIKTKEALEINAPSNVEFTNPTSFEESVVISEPKSQSTRNNYSIVTTKDTEALINICANSRCYNQEYVDAVANELINRSYPKERVRDMLEGKVDLRANENKFSLLDWFKKLFKL